MVEAIQLLARTEGILLDTVYIGKVMAAFVGMIREGKFKEGEFLHIGRSPALYTYTDEVLK